MALTTRPAVASPKHRSRLRRSRFGRLTIEYDERVLRPRRWTTYQSRWAAELLMGAPAGPVLELCAGAGQIGLLAVASSGRSLVCVDVDPIACDLARRNADANGMGGRVEVRCGDLSEALRPREMFPVIVADPPYLGPDDVARFPEDPRLAVDGGPDGMSVVWPCLEAIRDHLAPGGSAVLQLHSSDQAHRVQERLATTGDLSLAEYRSRGAGVLALLRWR